MLQRIKYKKGQIKKYLGVKYRVYQFSPDSWFWETRKWFIWSTYPHACYNSEAEADQAARNALDACSRNERIF